MSEKTLLSECIEEVLSEHSKKELDLTMYKMGKRPICETSINRIMSHGEHGFIIISSQRSSIETWDNNPELSLQSEYDEWLNGQEGNPELEKEFLKERNAKAEQMLNQQIRQAGYAYSPVYGGYNPDGSYDVFEISYIVYNHKKGDKEGYGDFNELFNYAIEWCKEFMQESVYVQAPNEAPNYYDRNGNQCNSSSSKNFKFNRPEEFFTTTKRKSVDPKKFTADIQFENFYRRGIVEKMGRQILSQRGEVLFDDIDMIKRKS